MPLIKNSEYMVRINGYNSEGAGIARIEGQVVFVPNAIDGELCHIRILKVTKNLAYARLIEVVEPSLNRITPDCPSYPKCGGCDFWHLSYDEELKIKENHVRDALQRIGGLNIPINPIVRADFLSRYRNKAQFPVGQNEEGTFSGFYRTNSHDIISSEDCLIQSELANTLRTIIHEWMDTYKIPAYDETTERGFIRHIYVRTGESGAVLCIITAKKPPHLKELINAVVSNVHNINGIVLNYNPKKTNVIMGRKSETIYGVPYIEDTVCGLRFRLSPQSFYQVNRAQAERLYNIAVELACSGGAKTALDLYCGTGTITLCLAKRLNKVIGVEVIPEAIENAKENARLNGMDNAEFICADAGEAAEKLLLRNDTPDVIVVDPPRKGLDKKVIEIITMLNPEKVVYISCDAGTLARDLKFFNETTPYRPQSATPVDLFPRTKHVEAVIMMTNCGSKGK